MAKTKATKEIDDKLDSSASSPPPVMFRTPSHQEIAERAYALYLLRAGASGTPEADWFKAETELSRG